MRIIPVGISLALRLRMTLLWQIIRSEGPTLPNFVTMVRIGLSVGMFLYAERPMLVFWLAFAAWISDGIDGWLAKTFGWCTRLGARLDQWADWGFGFALLYVLCVAEHLTLYNIPLVLLISGYLFARMRYLMSDTTDIAKWKTFVQFFGGVVILAGHAWGDETVRDIGYGIIVASLPLMYWSLQSYRQKG